jgi:hypothetical protein
MIVSKRPGLPPHITPVPRHLLQCQSGNERAVQGEGSNADTTHTISIPSSTTVARFNAVPQSQALLYRPHHQLEVTYTSETVTLHYGGLTHGLVRLPKWSGMDNIAPSIYLPQHQGESIRVVLDIPSQQQYVRSASVDHRFPVIIERQPLPGLVIKGEEVPDRAQIIDNEESTGEEP